MTKRQFTGFWFTLVGMMIVLGSVNFWLVIIGLSVVTLGYFEGAEGE